MKVTVNGEQKTLKDGATLKDALKGVKLVPDTDISVFLSSETVREDTNDFRLFTARGEMILHLDDTPDAKVFRSLVGTVKGSNARWVTNALAAFGAFPSDLKKDTAVGKYRQYDVYFLLGGNDNATTYLVIARRDQIRTNGVGGRRIGNITEGRFLLKLFKEGDAIEDIVPAVKETSVENVVITRDMDYVLTDGCIVDSEVRIELDHDSPQSAEHLLILASRGYLDISESSGTFAGCRDDMDVTIPEESSKVREEGSVMVRNTGTGTGHILFYKERRQMSPEANSAGKVVGGMPLIRRAASGGRIAVRTVPPRLISVGMTQKQAAEMLEAAGVKQIRKGDVSDDAIVSDQVPEATMEAMKKGEVETVGVPRDKIIRVEITAEPATAHYFRKVTGLSHKAVGQMKTQFSFPDSPMVTFYGDEARAQDLEPQEKHFTKCKKGDVGVTNQARPHHGLMGIRLTDSKEFGPTGEEPYGTNIVGRVDGPLDGLDELDDDSIVYVTEMKI